MHIYRAIPYDLPQVFEAFCLFLGINVFPARKLETKLLAISFQLAALFVYFLFLGLLQTSFVLHERDSRIEEPSELLGQWVTSTPKFYSLIKNNYPNPLNYQSSGSYEDYSMLLSEKPETLLAFSSNFNEVLVHEHCEFNVVMEQFMTVPKGIAFGLNVGNDKARKVKEAILDDTENSDPFENSFEFEPQISRFRIKMH